MTTTQTNTIEVKSNNTNRVVLFSWMIVLAVVAISFMAWGQNIGWRLSSLTIYKIFPLLGLLAFSLMWTHYITGAVRRLFGVDKESLKSYFSLTGIAVLFLIILHPGLLIFQLWNDGLGLPPGSVIENYVAPTAKFAVILGIVSWLVFLSFELRHKIAKYSWWKIVDYAQILAMAAIFIHGLQLGGTLQINWYRIVWNFYGATLVIAVCYTYFLNASKEGKV